MVILVLAVGYDICSTFDMPNKEFSRTFYINCRGRIRTSNLSNSCNDKEFNDMLRKKMEDDEL